VIPREDLVAAWRRATLIAQHGRPAAVNLEVTVRALSLLGLRAEVHPRDVVAFCYRDAASAVAWAEANLQHYGHPDLGHVEVGGQLVGLLDLRPALIVHGAQPTSPGEPDDYNGRPRRTTSTRKGSR
jgi:hypothetical protein